MIQQVSYFSTSNFSKYDAAADVSGLKNIFVNVFFVGNAQKWFLVDAGLNGFYGKIKSFAEHKFGTNNPPEFILLTHGHFDHVGALEALLKDWNVPVYAHALELPYLRGKSAYPPPDPAIGGGAMAYMSWAFPVNSVDLGDKVKTIDADASLPGFPEWKVIHTPGHSPGHISLFRESDKVLIAGDAFVTVNQNSAMSVMSQKQEVCGPPAYFTCDWNAAKNSVKVLNDLNPEIVASGHGIPMSGDDLKNGLQQLAQYFERKAIPSKNGRYVKRAAVTDQSGIIDMPPPTSFYLARTIAILGVAAITTLEFLRYSERKSDNKRYKKKYKPIE